MAGRSGRSAASASGNWRRRSGSFWPTGGEQQLNDSESECARESKPNGGEAQPHTQSPGSGPRPERPAQWRRHRPKSQMFFVGCSQEATFAVPTSASAAGLGGLQSSQEARAYVPSSSSTRPAGDSDHSQNWRNSGRAASQTAQAAESAAARGAATRGIESGSRGCGRSANRAAHRRSAVVEYTSVHVQSTCDYVVRKSSCDIIDAALCTPTPSNAAEAHSNSKTAPNPNVAASGAQHTAAKCADGVPRPASPTGSTDCSCSSNQFYDDDDILVATASYAPHSRQATAPRPQQHYQPPRPPPPPPLPPHKSTRPYFERGGAQNSAGSTQTSGTCSSSSTQPQLQRQMHTFQTYVTCSSHSLPEFDSSRANATTAANHHLKGDSADSERQSESRQATGVSERIARALKSCRDQFASSATPAAPFERQQPPAPMFAGCSVRASQELAQSKKQQVTTGTAAAAALVAPNGANSAPKPLPFPPAAVPERRAQQRAPRHVRQIRIGAGEDWLPSERIELLLAPSTVAELVIGASDEEREYRETAAAPALSQAPASTAATARLFTKHTSSADADTIGHEYPNTHNTYAGASQSDEWGDGYFSDSFCPSVLTATVCRPERSKHSSERLFEELNELASGIGDTTFLRFDAIDNQLHDIMSTSLTRVSYFRVSVQMSFHFWRLAHVVLNRLVNLIH